MNSLKNLDGQMHPQTFDALKPFGGAIMDTRQLQINTGSSASKLKFYQHYHFLGSKRGGGGGGVGGGANGEMANLTNEKGKFAIAIFRHFSPLAPPPIKTGF